MDRMKSWSHYGMKRSEDVGGRYWRGNRGKASLELTFFIKLLDYWPDVVDCGSSFSKFGQNAT
jgi:hypothetical protein